MDNHKQQKISVKLIPFGSSSQKLFYKCKGKERFARNRGTFYVIKNNVTIIISGDFPIQLVLLTLHNKTSSKGNSQALYAKNDIV